MSIKIAVVGYVGLSIAALLAQHHSVVTMDVIAVEVKKINRRESPIAMSILRSFLLRMS